MRFGVSIQELARLVGEGQTDDPSLNLLLALAAAQKAVADMQRRGVDIAFNGRLLIQPSLEQAYREAAYVRAGLAEPWLVVDGITRYGRLVDAGKIQNLFTG